MLTIYKASAGSGKTFTLTLEYIKMLLGRKNNSTGNYELATHPENAHKTILAVTFTNKATEEMKRRIIKELSLLAEDPLKSPYLKELKQHFNCNDDTRIALAASNAIYSLLFKYSYFNVSTIDSFFQLVLRTFANEIDRPGNFDIEMDEKYTLEQGITSMLDTLALGECRNEFVRRDYLKQWLRIFMSSMIENGRSFNLFNRNSSLHVSLVKTMQTLLDETYRINSEEINSYLDNPEKLVAYNKALTSEIEKILTSRANAATALKASLKNDGLIGFCNISTAWLEERISHVHGKELNKTMTKALENPSKAFKATSTINGQKMKCPAVSDSIMQLAWNTLSTYQSTRPRLITLTVIKSHLFYMGLLGTLTKVVNAYCRDNNMILISDTNELLGRIIGKDLTPFIYERMGVKLRHFLIDEFQDTSRMQWNNFIPLLFESLSNGNDNLIIGDEKQCIYRFRNSAPELLGHEVENMVEPLFHSINKRGLVIEENRNWRSASEIVRFNNSLFYAIGAMPGFPANNAYRNVIQEIPERHSDFHGYVEIDFIRGCTKNEAENAAVEKTLQHLKRMLDVYSPADIAILVRKNEQAKTIVDAMLSAMQPKDDGTEALLPRFEIISNQALTIESAPAVKLIVNIMKLVDTPENIGPESEAARNRRFKNKTDMTRLHHRYEIFMAGDGDSETALARAADCDDYTDSLLDIAMDKNCNDVCTVVERIISKLPDELRTRDTIFLTAFQDLVISFSNKGTGDLHSFLNWWEISGRMSTLDSPEGSNALTVTTIHKSKGIEYRCVIIPFADWTFYEDSTPAKQLISWHRCPDISGIEPALKPPFIPLEKVSRLQDTLFADEYAADCARQRIDAINLTYVAFTRAVEELIVISEFPANKSSENAAMYIESAMLSMTPGHLAELSETLLPQYTKWLVSLSDKYNEDTDTIIFGNPRKTVSEIIESTETEPMPPYTTYDNSDLMRIVKVEDDEDFDPENARVMGNFMHSVMSKVRNANDIEYACRLRAEQTGLTKELTSERTEILRKALGDKRVERWFNGFTRVVSERPLVIDSNHSIRPDRVVWTADGHIDVVDYKFGELHDDKYRSQVQKYVNSLRLGGYSNVRGYLWYPLESIVITVDDGNTQKTLF